MRTARILNEGQLEVSTGVAYSEWGGTPVVLGAYGVTEHIELEAMYTNEMGTITPRVQLLHSEKNHVDFLVFMDVGYGKEPGFSFGPGIMLGRKFGFIEPYLSYQFMKYPGFSAQYLLAGNRFHLPFFSSKLDKKSMKWFIGVEGGFLFSDYYGWNLKMPQYAINLGFKY